MTDRKTGSLRILATALSPIHHGAGTSGNTATIRRDHIITPDGLDARVPFVSGNSLRHMIRAGAVQFALETMDVEDASLPKAVVDLLFSGGALTKTGTAVDIGKARELERLFPILSVMGYAAGNHMTASRVRLDDLHVVCAENAWRMPAEARELPHAQRRALLYTDDRFGTRHDVVGTPGPTRLIESEELAEIEGDKAAKAASGKGARDKGTASTQMIYEHEVIRPGTRFWGCLYFEDLTELEIAALGSGLTRACEGIGPSGGHILRVGARSAQGFGQIECHFTGILRRWVQAPSTDETSIVPIGKSGDRFLDPYVEHLREHRADILAALAQAAS